MTTTAGAMSALKKKKRTIRGHLTRTEQLMESIVGTQTSGILSIENLSRLEAALDVYKKHAEIFEQLVNDLLSLADEADADFASTEKSYLDSVSDVNEILVKFEAKKKTFHKLITGAQARESLVPSRATEDLLNTSMRGDSFSFMPKLEKIQVPKFSGDLLDFPNFKGMYDNLVHNNPDLNGVHKLHYLKQALLDGDAHELVRDFPLTETAYAEAYALINSRFDNKRAAIRALFRKLLNIESISSNTKLGSLIDKVDSLLRGLKSVGEKIDDTFSRFIAYLVSTKLDKKTAEDWENSFTSTKSFPLYNDLQKFLQARLFSVEERNSDKQPVKSTPTKTTSVKSSYTVGKQISKCSSCKKDAHPIYRCGSFLDKTPRERYEFVKRNKLCVLCLQSGHSCSNCPNSSSKFACSCNEPHNYLLHFRAAKVDAVTKPNKEENWDDSVKPANNQTTENTSADVSKKSFSCSTVEEKREIVLLPSALVRFRCGEKSGLARILLDSGSQVTMIADTFVKKHRLLSFQTNSLIKGIGNSPIETSEAVKLSLHSKKANKFALNIEADVVPKSSLNYSATVSLTADIIKRLKKLQEDLAEPSLLDPTTQIDSVDIVVGAQYFEDCITNRSLSFSGLKLRLSKFGWIASGAVAIQSKRHSKFSGLTLNQINENLTKFWQIEEAEPSNGSWSPEEESCVKHFENNYSFAADGKFVIKLPLKASPSEISRNRFRAEFALRRVENKLSDSFKAVYSDFLAEYQKLGHMSEVKTGSSFSCYLPHREVLRESSSTTPLRVVFNASARSAGKLSLNQALMVGPSIQRDLFDILVSSRSHKFLYTADIEKMYRMIWVHVDDRDLQRILWRDSPSNPISEFQLNTLTFGTSPASFIAQKCLATVAESVEAKNSKIAKIIKENFYMDDISVGAETEEELIRLMETVRTPLRERGFNLRKYSSNSAKFMESLPAEFRNSNKQKVEFRNPFEVTVLGMIWTPTEDSLGIRLNTQGYDSTSKVSRRSALSTISKTFDPLGLLAPVLIRGKLLLQDFWKEGKEWDSTTSDDLNRKFHQYIDDLAGLADIKIPRKIFQGEKNSIFAFCDASEKAYCAVIYARTSQDGDYLSRIISSKTRVAPLKQLTVPKLELQAAKLLADLVKRVINNLNFDIRKVYAFTDSTVVLCWLSKPSAHWKTFVRNRVEKITAVLPFDNWRYVKTYDNPADLATRGLTARELSGCQMWFEGPKFAEKEKAESFHAVPDFTTHSCLEKRRIKSVEKHSFACVLEPTYLEKFSSYTRLIRVVAYILRFVRCIKSKVRAKNAILSKSECEAARLAIIRSNQSVSFRDEIALLKEGESLKKKSSIRSLDPFLDSDQILRVGGRLKLSSLPIVRKHPIIVSAKSYFARLYTRYVHEKYFHAGKKFILSFLASEFWIFNGRNNLVKRVIRECVTCRRMKGESAAQIMGQLPLPRIKISKPFSYVGVDYAGYFDCKCVAHRTVRYYKIYAAIFICLTTRAVHIEVVPDLSTDGLIEALIRMTARRGLPVHMYSDNGTNMVGAGKLLTFDREKLESFAANERFQWSYIPPRSPNFGGIWEAAVRSAKKHLAVVVKGQVLNVLEYCNIFTRIEAILNSRPLCYRADAEQGNEAITPAHFLIGDSLLAVPQIDDDSSIPLSRRLQLIRSQINSFWRIWSKDYINQLQQRVRWQTRQPNLAAGQVVLLKSEATKPFQWPLARVEKVYPDAEGNVRVVDVKVRGCIKTRSLASIVPLLES